MFLHESIYHIGFNMLSLYFVGRPLEMVIGRARFLTIFLVGGVAGDVLAFCLTPLNVPTLGASGAIFAVFGTLIVVARRAGMNLRGMIGILVLNLVFSFSGGLTGTAISWQAHIGGLVAGVLLGLVLVRARGRHGTVLQVASIAAVLVIIVVAVLARTADLGGSLV